MLTICLGCENLELFLGSRQKVFAVPSDRLPRRIVWHFAILLSSHTCKSRGTPKAFCRPRLGTTALDSSHAAFIVVFLSFIRVDI